MEIVIKSADYRRLGERIIKEHEDLHWIKESQIKIGYVESDKGKLSNGYMAFADCNKVPALYKAYIPYDFVIRFYVPNVILLTDEQIDILMYHELLHVGMDENGNTRIVPHDVEDFRCILDQYGLDWKNRPEGGEPYGKES